MVVNVLLCCDVSGCVVLCCGRLFVLFCCVGVVVSCIFRRYLEWKTRLYKHLAIINS